MFYTFCRGKCDESTRKKGREREREIENIYCKNCCCPSIAVVVVRCEENRKMEKTLQKVFMHIITYGLVFFHCFVRGMSVI